MLYFTNQELAETNHVSVRTVRNWIDSARDGKVDLTLHEKGERHYIANTSKNSLIIRDLVNKNKKYRPHRSQKTVMPQSKFYDLYTQEQLYDLVSNLQINHELPRQYNYFGEGAHNWDVHATHLSAVDTGNLIKASIELLDLNQSYIDHLLEKYDRINVIDIGVGNALPVRKLLEHLQGTEKLGRYIAIDISPAMLEVAEKNIKSWFGNSINFEGHTLDIDHDRFGNLLANEYIKSDSDSTTNLILFLGGTIANFKKPAAILQVIHDSMGVNDFFVHHQTLDTVAGRHYFDFNHATPNFSLAPIHRYIFDLLNIDDTLYELDMGFDGILNERYIKVNLKIALSIQFTFDGGERIISFNKGDSILLWRHRHQNIVEMVQMLRESEFMTLQTSQATDQQSVLTISRIKHD